MIKWRRNIFLYLTECFRRAVCFVGGNDIIKICYGYLEELIFVSDTKSQKKWVVFSIGGKLFSCCLVFRNKFKTFGFSFTSGNLLYNLLRFVKKKSESTVCDYKIFLFLLKSIIFYLTLFFYSIMSSISNYFVHQDRIK